MSLAVTNHLFEHPFTAVH